ncbi:hypothetical protein MRX96_021886 [Rhipicephalus microplus]
MNSRFGRRESGLLNCKSRLRLERTDLFLVQVTRIRRKNSKRVSRKRLQGGTYRCLVPPEPLGSAARRPKTCVGQCWTRCLPRSRTPFSLGTTKVFVREALEQYLEQERVALLRASIVVIQRHVRGYLARRQYTAMRAAALRIQGRVSWIRRKEPLPNDSARRHPGSGKLQDASAEEGVRQA